MRIADRKESPIIGLTGMGGGLASYILYGGSGSGDVYEISRSLRFDDSNSAYLSRNVSSQGHRRKWTWSGWVKRSGLGVQYIWGNANSSALNGFMLRFEGSDAIRVSDWGSSSVWSKVTSAVFKDVSAWYHIVVSYDTENATAADKVKLYVNGSRITDFSTNENPSDYYDGFTNAAQIDSIGRWGQQAAYYLDGYLADIHFVDGQALDETSFGEFDIYGVWNPKQYTGTYVDWFNNSQTWSDNTTGTFAGNYEALAFNGVLSTSSTGGRVRPSNGTTAGFTFSNLGTVTSLRIWVHQGGTGGTVFTVNGTDVTSTVDAATNSDWVDFGSTFSELTAITFNAASNGSDWYSIAGIEVNGKLLIDSNLSFANNSYRLNFSDNTSTITLGADSSGESNDWTLNSFSVASGSGNDSLLDSPTNYSADSGNNGGNYATLNPLHGRLTLSNGNLDSTSPSGWKGSAGTIGMTSGKYYWEIDNVVGNEHVVGIVKEDVNNITWNNTYGYGAETGAKYLATSGVTYGDAWTTGDVIGVAFDADVGTLTFYKDGVSQGIAAYGLLNGPYLPSVVHNDNTRSSSINFGQRPWTHTPPTGHVALCTQNLPTPAILKSSEHIGITTYASDGNATAITGLSFSPDLVWQKQMTGSDRHFLTNSVRGAGLALRSDEDYLEGSTDAVASFTSDGCTIGAGAANANQNSQTYVGWTWNAGSNSNRTYNVTVVDDGGNKYRFNGHGTSAVTLELEEGSTYTFDQSDSSNGDGGGHPLRFATAADAAGNTEYTIGVETNGTPGTAGAYTRITVASGAPTLYYYCTNHNGMGGQINTNATTGSSVLSGGMNSSYYNTDAHWSQSSSITTPGNVFDGSLGSSGVVNSGGSAVTVTTSSFSARRIRFYKNGNDDAEATKITINSTDYFFPVQTKATGWAEVDFGSTITVTSFTTTWYGNYTLYAIEVDGKILTDSTVTPTSVPSVDTVVRANQTAGFSVVKWQGDSNAQTVAHGLSGEPSFILMKDLDNNAYWRVYHNGGDFTTGSGGAFSPFYHWRLDLAGSRLGTATDAFTNTRPTNTHFSVAANANTGGTKGMIAYCWQEIEGYSKFGNYTGNTTTMPFVYTGFKPRWIMVKSSTDSNGFLIVDAERNKYNYVDNYIYADVPAGENNNVSNLFTFTSNGFALGTATATNSDAVVYLYAAFAENPFKNVRAR